MRVGTPFHSGSWLSPGPELQAGLAGGPQGRGLRRGQGGRVRGGTGDTSAQRTPEPRCRSPTGPRSPTGTAESPLYLPSLAPWRDSLTKDTTKGGIPKIPPCFPCRKAAAHNQDLGNHPPTEASVPATEQPHACVGLLGVQGETQPDQPPPTEGSAPASSLQGLPGRHGNSSRCSELCTWVEVR